MMSTKASAERSFRNEQGPPGCASSSGRRFLVADELNRHVDGSVAAIAMAAARAHLGRHDGSQARLLVRIARGGDSG
jgi:hypothetical protein